MRKTLPLLAIMLVVPFCTLQAQDPTEVDSDHYKIEFENEYVRVVRITYGVGEKSVMHDHPDGVAVFLVDQEVTMTLPGGETVDAGGKAGEAIWAPGGKHLPENVGEAPIELVLVEIKATAGDADTAIRAGSQQWSAAWNAGDPVALTALYAEDAVVMAPGTEPASGHEAIEKNFRQGLDAAPGSQVKIETLEVMAANGWAVEVGTSVTNGADGSHLDHGRYVAVWKRVGDEWLLYRDIWNSSMTP